MTDNVCGMITTKPSLMHAVAFRTLMLASSDTQIETMWGVVAGNENSYMILRHHRDVEDLKVKDIEGLGRFNYLLGYLEPNASNDKVLADVQPYHGDRFLLTIVGQLNAEKLSKYQIAYLPDCVGSYVLGWLEYCALDIADTALVIETAARQLNGNYACVIFDTYTKEIFIFRVGVKLFVTAHNGDDSLIYNTFDYGSGELLPEGVIMRISVAHSKLIKEVVGSFTFSRTAKLIYQEC